MKPLLSFWQKGEIGGLGDAALLEQPLTAFFASRRCSGEAIRRAMDWAVEQARNKTPLIGGFHSPLEQSVSGHLDLDRRRPSTTTQIRFKSLR